MVYVRLELKGGEKINRQFNAIRVKLMPELKSELTEVMYKKLKRIYATKRDTGGIFRSIKRDPKKGIITMGGTDDTQRTDFMGRTIDYTAIVEQTGSRAHTFFLPQSAGTSKLRGGRKYKVKSHQPVRGRRKAVARAAQLFKLLTERAIRKTVK